jgi:hypothetical protein
MTYTEHSGMSILTLVIPFLMIMSDNFHSDPEDQAMAIIVIKDLPDNINLDHEAMVAITGGARIRGRSSFPGRTIFRSSRIVAYPAGLASNPLVDANRQSTGNKPLK